MIKVKNVSKSFGGVQALHNVSFECKNGQILGLVGPNGSGKSTLLNIISGLLKLDDGSVKVSGGFSRTFQDSRLWESLSVIDHLTIPLKSGNPFVALGDFRVDYNKVDEILKRVGLLEHKQRKVQDLSYGQRKLLEIGRALSSNPINLLLDEPFAGLSLSMSQKLKEIIQEELQNDSAIIIVEHDISLIRKLCNEVVVLNAGEVLESGLADDIFHKPSVIEAYLGK